jgi:uncharacterized protein YbjT (DUF2867 family)
MKVLLTGQSGFIGSRLRDQLLRRGHDVAPVRVDFRTAQQEEAWLPHLDGIDVVINTAGIFRERRRGDFQVINEAAPCALFRAAASRAVRLLIQFSALGADAQASSRFHLSKRNTDACLRAQPVATVSLQPSLVFGAAGGSAQMMATLASLPLVPLPGAGSQMIQPIHVDDLVDAVVALVESEQSLRGARTIALVGPRALSLREYLQLLREGLGLPPARFMPVPMPLMRVMARLGSLSSALPLDPEALAMLNRGNVADSRDTLALLARQPRDPARFIAAGEAGALWTQAALQWLLPLLRVSLAVMWIWTAVVSVAVHPVDDSYRMLSASGVPAALLPLALYGAAALDLLLGVLSLLLHHRLLWQAQILLILGYTVIIALRLPEFLSHPFGPILKNLPILAALLLLAELAPRRPRKQDE